MHIRVCHTNQKYDQRGHESSSGYGPLEKRGKNNYMIFLEIDMQHETILNQHAHLFT